jgi:hypothetical protein
MKALAILGAVAAACVAVLPASATPASAARPAPLPVELVLPTAVPVPADVIAAHPDGHPAALDAIAVLRPASIAVTPNASERISCWRGYFLGDNSGFWGTEQEYINPYWCGNGSVTRGVDPSWHGESCNWFVVCAGETGVATWYGCPNGCASIGQQITGHFRVDLNLSQVSVDETVVYQLYGNGQYWSYAYHN